MEKLATWDGSSPNNPCPDWWEEQTVLGGYGRLFLERFDYGGSGRMITKQIDADNLPEWLTPDDLDTVLGFIHGKAEE